MNVVYPTLRDKQALNPSFTNYLYRTNPYMTHGGKRLGAGRPGTNLDEKRMLALQEQGYSQRAIGQRFGVSTDVIAYRMGKIKAAMQAKPD